MMKNEELSIVGLLDPLAALMVSFVLLAVMLYKRVNIGIALVLTAIVMSFLSLHPPEVPNVWIQTTIDPVTISLVLVTYGIMLLSLLYRETDALNSLSKSVRGLLRNPKLIAGILPALVGLLPVPGGALMSAPLVQTEAEKLGMKEDKKTYTNVWFRHIIFPIYPMSQLLILTAALTEAPITSIIISQIPVVAAMILVGYFSVLRKAQAADDSIQEAEYMKYVQSFLTWFSPIILMILTVALFRVDVSIATLAGIVLLLLLTRPPRKVLIRAVSNPPLYLVTLAAYGAMLLRSVTIASGISDILGQTIARWSVGEGVLLATIPAALAVLVGSARGGIAISVPILSGMMDLSAGGASLLYISAFLGYLASPTHLCLALTAEYFKCPLSKAYRLLLPSLAISFAVALLVFNLLQPAFAPNGI